MELGNLLDMLVMERYVHLICCCSYDIDVPTNNELQPCLQFDCRNNVFGNSAKYLITAVVNNNNHYGTMRHLHSISNNKCNDSSQKPNEIVASFDSL